MMKKTKVKQKFKSTSYLKNYKWLVFLGPFCKALEALSEVFAPYFMALIIDVGIKNNDKPYIIKYAIIILAINILGMVFATPIVSCLKVVANFLNQKYEFLNILNK